MQLYRLAVPRSCHISTTTPPTDFRLKTDTRMAPPTHPKTSNLPTPYQPVPRMLHQDRITGPLPLLPTRTVPQTPPTTPASRSRPLSQLELLFRHHPSSSSQPTTLANSSPYPFQFSPNIQTTDPPTKGHWMATSPVWPVCDGMDIRP